MLLRECRRRPCTFMIALLGLVLGNHSLHAEAERLGVVITRDGVLNIHSGAGENQPVIGKAAKNSILAVKEATDAWVRVRLPDGTEGYALGAYIHFLPAPATAGGRKRPNEVSKDSPAAEGRTVFESKHVGVVMVPESNVYAEEADEIIYRSALYEPLVMQEEPLRVLTPHGEIGRVDRDVLGMKDIQLLSGRMKAGNGGRAQGFRVLNCRVSKGTDGARLRYQVQFYGEIPDHEEEIRWVDGAEVELSLSAAPIQMGREWIYQSQNDLDKAEALFRFVLETYPEEMFLEFAECYGEINHSGLVALNALADIAINRGKHRQAIQYLEDMARRYPGVHAGMNCIADYNTATHGIAHGLARQKIATIHAKYLLDPGTAIRILQAIIKDYPKKEVFYCEGQSTLDLDALGLIGQIGKEHHLANAVMLEHIQLAIDAAGFNVVRMLGAIMKAGILREERRFSEAIEVLANAIQANPATPMTFFKDEVDYSVNALKLLVRIEVDDRNDPGAAIRFCQQAFRQLNAERLLWACLVQIAEILDNTTAPREEVIRAYELLAKVSPDASIPSLSAIRSFATYRAVASEDQVMLHDRASPSAPVSAVLKKGAGLSVMYRHVTWKNEQQQIWYKVLAESGAIGWLQEQEFTKKNNMQTTEKAAPFNDGAARVNAGEVVGEMERMLAEAKTTAKWAILRGLAPIVWAVGQRNPALVHKVIAEGFDLYQTDQEQPNALHVAIFNRDKEIVKILLAAGFDPERPACQDCGKDRSPLCSAVLENQPEIVRMLAKAGADVNAGKPVYQAAYEKLTDMVGLLLELGADPDVQGENEWTPLMYAAYWGDRQMAAHLLAAGADPGIRIKKGNSAFGYRDGDRAVEIARRRGNLELVKLLEQAAAQPPPTREKRKKPPTAGSTSPPSSGAAMP